MTGGEENRGAVRVLIVDDHRDFADNLAELARSRGLAPTNARTCREALDLARAAPFDVAIVDQELPDGVGTELLAALRRELPDVVTLVVTAFVSLDNSLAALREGAFAFMGKDSEPNELVETLARAAENARLRRENRSLRRQQDAMLLALPDFLLLADGTGRVTAVNQRHAALCPRPPAEASGVLLDDLLAPWLRARGSLCDWIACASRGDAAAERAVEAVDGDGRPSILGLRLVAIGATDPPLFLLRAVDLTDRISLERRLSESEHLAALGRLVSSIAHDLRNPLAGIRALAQLLQRSRDAAPRDAENVREILGLTDRMHATLSDLLEFARPGLRRDEPLALEELVASLLGEARRWPSADGRALELVGGPDGAPLVVSGVRERVETLVANLVDNALQAAPRGGRVRVALRRRDGRAEAAIEDDGPGIAPDALPNLFRPFFTTKTRGTGLGLAIARKNAEAMGGTIAVDRSPDLGGARFVVTLPLAR